MKTNVLPFMEWKIAHEGGLLNMSKNVKKNLTLAGIEHRLHAL